MLADHLHSSTSDYTLEGMHCQGLELLRFATAGYCMQTDDTDLPCSSCDA